ncbi:MAG: LacI family DNA-binding transcriptional regulator, partial [bacterium]
PYMGRERPPGIRDVAEKAGVSATTVSHALSGKGRISEETRARVMEAVAELDYRPNRNAQSLAKGGSGLVALVVGSNLTRSRSAIEALPDFMYLANIAVSASQEATRMGLGLLLAPEHEHLPTALDAGIGAALIVDPVTNEPSANTLIEAGIPYVTLGRIPGASVEENPYWVDNDHATATRNSLEHLRDQGARRIGLLVGDSETSYVIDSLEAYRQWCTETGQAESLLTISGRPFSSPAKEQVESLLRSPDRPDAVLCLLHPIASLVAAVALGQGLHVPDDLLIASVSDDRFVNSSTYGLPSITGTDLNPALLANEAMSIVASLLSDSEPEDPTRLIPSELVPRESSLRS